MEEVANFRLKSIEGDIIEFRPELRYLSGLFEELDISDIVPVDMQLAHIHTYFLMVVFIFLSKILNFFTEMLTHYEL